MSEDREDTILLTVQYRGAKDFRVINTGEDEFKGIDPDDVAVHLSKIALIAICEHLE